MNLPGGTVTFLFTDIAGSTRLWQEHPQSMPLVLARHDALLRTAIEQNNGFVVKTIGDAFMAVFPTAQDGLHAALTAQRSLLSEPWPQKTPIRVRMGLHAGAAEERDNDYFGHEVNRAARVQGVVHPEQIVISQAVYAQVKESLPDAVTLLELGSHPLKDLRDPEMLWQVCHPDLPVAFPPLNSLSHWPNNLPRQVSSFVGREREMAEVKSLLSGCSCLSLLGTGGTGKTRLALQVAAEVLPDFPHGVWLVELAALSEPSLVAQTVAAVIGLREEPGKALAQTLEEYCRSRTLLLVLDNCEHLIAACALLADRLLRSCPQMKVLATSREALNIAGEQTYRVPSLSLPDPRQSHTLQTLREYEASRLFLERATSVKPDFAVTERNASVLAQVCLRLDGVPLAIELAAARVRSLSVEEINNKLDHRFRLLTGGSRTALPRHQTLKALIDWSYDLLTDAEKTLLARLSVFAGGWTLAAAETVCAGDKIEDWETLDLLSSLVDKSLVVAEEKEGSVRYRMLETVREYAAEKLNQTGEEQALRGRHRDWFLALSEEVEPGLSGAEQGAWLTVLETEHDNLRFAIQESLSSRQGSEGSLRLCGALWRFWWMRGYLAEGRQWCEAALAREDAIERTAARAKVLNGAGMLAWHQGDYGAARAYFEQSLEIFREIGERRGIASSLMGLGNVASIQGDYGAARTYFEQSLEIRREIGDRQGIATSLNGLGNVAMDQGDYAAARAYFEQSLEIMRDIGDRKGTAGSLMSLGNVARSQNDYGAARTYYEQSLEISREIGERRSIATSLMGLGVVAFIQGDYAAARAYFEQSLEIYREIGDRQGFASLLGNLGLVARAQGDYGATRAYLEQSLEIKREIGDRHGIANSLNNLGGVASDQGDSAVARAYHEQSLEIRREIGDRQGIAASLMNLGIAAKKQDDYGAARAYLEQSLEIFREIGDRKGIAISLMNLGLVANDQGDYAEARAYLEQSLGIGREIGDRQGVAECLEAFASLASSSSRIGTPPSQTATAPENAGFDLQKASRLWGAAQALREQIGAPQSPREKKEQDPKVAEVRQRLGEETFTLAWEQGQQMTTEQAVAYALQESTDA